MKQSNTYFLLFFPSFSLGIRTSAFRPNVSHILCGLHDCTHIVKRSLYEKTLRQIHLSLCQFFMFSYSVGLCITTFGKNNNAGILPTYLHSDSQNQKKVQLTTVPQSCLFTCRPIFVGPFLGVNKDRIFLKISLSFILWVEKNPEQKIFFIYNLNFLALFSDQTPCSQEKARSLKKKILLLSTLFLCRPWAFRLKEIQKTLLLDNILY